MSRDTALGCAYLPASLACFFIFHTGRPARAAAGAPGGGARAAHTHARNVVRRPKRFANNVDRGQRDVHPAPDEERGRAPEAPLAPRCARQHVLQARLPGDGGDDGLAGVGAHADDPHARPAGPVAAEPHLG